MFIFNFAQLFFSAQLIEKIWSFDSQRLKIYISDTTLEY